MKFKLLNSESLNTDIASLILRLLFGCLFIHYGYTKLMVYDDILPKFPDLIGIGSKTSLILVIFAELVCGFFIAIGLFTRLAVIPTFITMMVAFFIAHAQDDFQTKTLPFVFLVLSIIIFLLGSGKFSVDHKIIKLNK